MKILHTDISINGVKFDFVNSLEISSSWELLTDKATIVLPSSLKIEKNKISEFFKVGDSVSITVGYDNDLFREFSGYITQIKPSVPLEISCEDEMWKLKQDSITDSGKNATLSDVIAKHFSEYETKILDIELGRYAFDAISRAQLLEKIKADFGLFSFFRDGVLVVGRRYDAETARHAKIRLDFNPEEDELVFKSKEDIKLKVKAVSNNPDGSKEEVEIGDQEGEERSLNFYDLSKSELKTAAEREFDRLIYDGWHGSLKAFGQPFCQHGDILELISEEESDKSGSYWIDETIVEYGVDGFRRTITLGAKV